MKLNDYKHYKQMQEEGFAKLQEMVEPFMAKSSSIRESINRIESIFKEYIVLGIDWEATLDRVNANISSKDISQLEASIVFLADLCEEYDEE